MSLCAHLLQSQLEEASDGLEAAARLSEQLDKKEAAIQALREEGTSSHINTSLFCIRSTSSILSHGLGSFHLSVLCLHSVHGLFVECFFVYSRDVHVFSLLISGCVNHVAFL